MKNVRFFFLTLVAMFSLTAGAYNHVGAADGTINIGAATNPGASNKFYKLQDGAYMWRASSNHSFSSGKGIKTQNSQSGVVFYISQAKNITPIVTFESTKNAANVTADLYTISDSEYEKFFTGTNNSTTVTFSKSTYATKTIVIENAKGDYSETFTNIPAGYYFIVCTGSASNTYFSKLTFAASEAAKSSDATLSDLQVGGETIDGFDGDKTEYTYEIAATASEMPTVTATKNDQKASEPVIVQAAMPTAGNPTQATVTVTAEDGTTTLTYTITFTRAELSHDATLKSIEVDGQAVSGFAPATLSYTVSVPYSQTAVPVVSATANFAAANVQITQPTAVEGSATIVVTAEDGTTQKTYTLTLQKVAASTDATLSSLKYNGLSVPNFSASKTDYNIDLPEGSSAPVVVAVANHPFATLTYKQASSTTDFAKVTVTAEDGSTQKIYTINFSEAQGQPVPPTNLTIHIPEVYEARSIAGGYGGTLTVVNGHEYEVYYTERTPEGDYPTFSTMPVSEGKTNGISGSTSANKNVGRAGDTWFEGTIASHSECKNASSVDEFVFGQKMIREHRLGSSDTYKFHIKGYDQFSLWGMDKKLDPKNGDQVFVVKVDGVEQTTAASLYNTTNYTVRRYNISTKEHLIEISTTATGSNVCYMGGFSLRVPQEPRTRWVSGNDSTQRVLATTAPKAIYYFTKYNSKGETRLLWDGEEGTGITLETKASTAIGDTLMLSGLANCAAGTYHYRVASYMNGRETSSVLGSLSVYDHIQAITDTVIQAFVGEEMEAIKLRYYSADPDGWNISSATWPEGITSSRQNGIITIAGTPTTAGEYPMVVKMNDGDSVHCLISVTTIDYGNDPILYLYKNIEATTKDGVYKYLTSAAGGSKNLIARKTKEDGLRGLDQYAKYKWILISEDVDANNEEVMAIARGEAGLPVLNMKSFSYSPGRLDWGAPDNGSLTKENGRYITVQREDHPIFKALNKKRGDRIMVISDISIRGLMPAAVDYQGTLCLATAWTRDIDDYYGDGVQETFLHEVPADLRNGQKYICLPIGIASSEKLTTDGKKLIDEVVKYLLNNQTTVEIPDLELTSFKVLGESATIDQFNDSIYIEFDLDKHPTINLSALAPEVAVASSYTHVTPSSGETVDFSKSAFRPVKYVVSDYINRREYNVVIKTINPEAIENVYTVGDWVNIYDIYGRKVTTTNENVYQMDLPHGIYIVVSSGGQTLKIMK